MRSFLPTYFFRLPLKRVSLALAGAAALTLSAAMPASAIQVTTPAGFETIDANATSDGPIRRNFSSSTGGGSRFQQIFDSSLFSSLIGPQMITEIQFRAANTENMFRPNSITASDSRVALNHFGHLQPWCDGSRKLQREFCGQHRE